MNPHDYDEGPVAYTGDPKTRGRLREPPKEITIDMPDNITVEFKYSIEIARALKAHPKVIELVPTHISTVVMKGYIVLNVDDIWDVISSAHSCMLMGQK